MESVEFIEILKTFREDDIALVKSILIAHKIQFMIEGENFLQLHGSFVQPARFKVDKRRLEDARALLADFLNEKE